MNLTVNANAKKELLHQELCCDVLSIRFSTSTSNPLYIPDSCSLIHQTTARHIRRKTPLIHSNLAVELMTSYKNPLPYHVSKIKTTTKLRVLLRGVGKNLRVECHHCFG